jgi:hypothetical protein
MKELAKGIDLVAVGGGVGVNEHAKWQPHWRIEKYSQNGEMYSVEEFDSNCLLNEGITELLNLLIGGSATAFNNANTFIGIGDGTTAAEASQEGLQGTNKAYKPMVDTYPQVQNQTVVFRSTFGPDDANFAWQEFTISNGNSDSAKNLNRKVENHGTKAQGDTWVIIASITIA